MLIELDVFSGRDNPRWHLDVDGASALRALHRDLIQSAEPVSEPPGLGYRGFHYTLDGTPHRAWNGTVAGPAGTLLDPARTVERLLLGSLPGEHADLHERLAREIARAP